MPAKGEIVGTCTRPGCPNDVRHPSRLYCGPACSKIVARRKSSASQKANKPGVRDYDPGMRNCLGCGKDFMSSSNRNRICPHCTKNQATSVPMRTPPGCKADEE